MNLLVLKGFNNYFNRIIKRYSTLADYISHSESHYDFANINFNPNDGVTTTQILGSENQKDAGGPDLVPLAWEKDGNPDYIIAYETEQVGIATVQVIRSRWFIIESVRTRNGQYSLKLKRDSIADHLESLLSAPAFIKKGTVSDDNPLVVNSEGITVNQIKSGETLLKDKTGSAWIVGYMAKNAPAATITEQIPDETQIYFETLENIADEFGVDVSDLGAALTQAQDNPSYFVNDNIEFVGWINYPDATSREIRLIAGSQNTLESITYGSGTTYGYHSNVSDCFGKIHFVGSGNVGGSGATTLEGAISYAGKNWWTAAFNSQISAIKANWKSWTSHPLFSKALFTKLQMMSENRTLIYKAGRYYAVKINGSSGPTPTGETYFVSAAAGTMRTICSSFISTFNSEEDPTAWYIEDLEGGKIFISYNELVAKFYLEEVTNTSDIPGITVTMSSTRNVIQNQPYDMFAIPYSNIIASDGVDDYEVNGDYAQKIAMALIKGLTNANVYDIQLLPYCPIPQIADDNSIDVSGLTSGEDYDWIEYTGAYLKYFSETKEMTSWSPVSEGLWRSSISVETSVNDYSDIDDWDVELETTSTRIVNVVKSYIASTPLKLIVQFDILSIGTPTASVTAHFWWKEKRTGTIHRSIIIYPKNNSFSVALDYNLTLKESMKIDSQTDLYRLVSPNYQGSFDFNVAKNGGAVNGFIADCTYKPYTPYIKVSPNFSWLYGSNYGDCRGLICGGCVGKLPIK